jgi:hypothetical protein
MAVLIHHCVRWALEKAQTRMAVKMLRQEAVGSKMPSFSSMSDEQANKSCFGMLEFSQLLWARSCGRSGCRGRILGSQIPSILRPTTARSSLPFTPSSLTYMTPFKFICSKIGGAAAPFHVFDSTCSSCLPIAQGIL